MPLEPIQGRLGGTNQASTLAWPLVLLVNPVG
jgi:hypothetical protein